MTWDEGGTPSRARALRATRCGAAAASFLRRIGASVPTTPLARRFGAWTLLGAGVDAMCTLALAQIVVFDLGHGVTRGSLARTLLTATIPLVLAAPAAGWAADRWDRRKVITATHLGRAGVAVLGATVPLLHARWLGFLVAGTLLGLAGMSVTIRASSLPHLSAGDELVASNSALSLAGKLGGSFGYLAAAAVVTNVPSVVLVVASLAHLALARAWLGFGHALGGGIDRADGTAPQVASGTELWSLVRRSSTRRAVLVACLQRGVYAAVFVVVALWADVHESMSASGYVVAIGIGATGAFVATLTTPVLDRVLPRSVLQAMCPALVAVGALAAEVSPSAGTMLCALVAASFGFQSMRLLGDSSLQQSVADETLGRVYSTFDVACNASFLAGATIALAAPDGRSHSSLGALAAAEAVIAAALWLAPMVRAARRRTPPTTERSA
jgi:hypothetical protein